METNFGNVTRRTRYADFAVYSTVSLPTGRQMANGQAAVLIGDLYTAASGRGAARTVTISLGGSSWTGTLGAAGQANDTGWLDSSNWITSATSAEFRISPSGSIWFGGRDSGGTTSPATPEWTTGLGGGFSWLQAPTAPRNTRVAANGATGVTVTWDAPTDNGGTGVSGYHVEIATDSGFTKNKQTSGSGSFSGIPAGSTVYARVAAKNAVTEAAGTVSVFSNTASVGLAVAPSAPEAPVLVQSGGRVFRASWTAPANGGAPITGYEVQTANNSAMTAPKTVTVSSAEASVSDLPEGRNMWVRVRANNAVGPSPWSPVAGLTLAVEPSAPRNLAAEQTGPGSFRLTWDAPVGDGGAAITSHLILIDNNADRRSPEYVLTGPEREFVVTDRPAGSAWYVWVGARNVATFEAPDAYSAPVRVVLREQGLSLDGWAGFNDGATGFEVLEPEGVRRGSLWTVEPPAPVGLIRESEPTGEVHLDMHEIGIEREVTGLTPGLEYTVRASATSLGFAVVDKYALGVVGLGYADPGDLAAEGAVTALPEFTFEASEEAHTIRIASAVEIAGLVSGSVELAGFFEVQLIEHRAASDYRLQSTVYESSLSNHLSLASNSVGATWWVGSDDVARFREFADRAAVKATFTDTRTPGHLEYTDCAVSYDTRNTVTWVDIENKGRNAVTGDEENFSLSWFITDSDVLGIRKAKIETNLHSPRRMANLIANPTGAGDEKGMIGRGHSYLAPHPDYVLLQRDEAGEEITGTTGTAYRAAGGQPWTARAEMFSTVPGHLAIELEFHNDTSGVIDTITHKGTYSGGGWSEQVFPPYIAPAGTTAVIVRWRALGDVDVHDELRVRNMRLVQSDEENITYLDGDSDDVNGERYSWTLEGFTQGEDRTHVDNRGREILTDNSYAENRVTQLRWNAQESPAVAASLDIQDRITVHRRGVDVEDYRIIGIKHELPDGKRWMMTLDLIPNEVA